MESSDFQGVLLTSYNITPQGGREDVFEDQSLVQTGIKAPFASSQNQSRHPLLTVSLDRNGSKVPNDRHMPELPYIIHAITPSMSLPRGLQHRGKNNVHISYSRLGRSASACAIAGTRLHPSLRVSTDVSTASFTIARHLHLLPKSNRSLVCLIF